MQTIKINEPSILIRINKTYNSTMSEISLYDYTRGRWRVNTERASKAKFAFAIFDGVIQEIFEIHEWHKAGTTESSRKPNDRPDLNSTKSLVGRFEFTGEIAPEKTRTYYIGKSVKDYFKKGNSNPIYYINC